jgi:hypothetical protein
MTTVNFGTWAQATAITILAPSRAMPPFSYLRPTMKPVMFCRNSNGMLALGAQFDEVRALERGFREQDAVVGDNADRIAVQMREAGHERGAVARLEFVEAEPSTRRAMTSRTSYGLRVSAGITP